MTFPTGPAGSVNASIAITSAGAVRTGQSAVTRMYDPWPGCRCLWPAVTTTPAGGIFNTGDHWLDQFELHPQGAAARSVLVPWTETATPGGGRFAVHAHLGVDLPGGDHCRRGTGCFGCAGYPHGRHRFGHADDHHARSGRQAAPSSSCSIPATAHRSNFCHHRQRIARTLTTGAPVADRLSCVPQPAIPTATLTCTQTATPGPNSGRCHGDDHLPGRRWSADLSTTLTDSGSGLCRRQSDHTATATNAGPSDATGVTITLPLPTGTSLVSGSVAGGGTCAQPGGLLRSAAASLPVAQRGDDRGRRGAVRGCWHGA
ncbi:MAG: DUF11 domain-containing protein [Rhodanobacteraceae bacterium]|nr:DUF11 domain-containing protein [Rhodanobacteraceae bacterium]